MGVTRTKHAEKFKYNAKAESVEELVPPRALPGGSYDVCVPGRFIRNALRLVSAGRGAAARTDGGDSHQTH